MDNCFFASYLKFFFIPDGRPKSEDARLSSDRDVPGNFNRQTRIILDVQSTGLIAYRQKSFEIYMLNPK